MSEGLPTGKVLHCRRCGAGFPSLKTLAAHVRADHAAEFREAASAGYRRRQTETRKIDQAIAAEQSPAPAPAGPSAAPPRAPAVHTPRPNHVCPTCGGQLPQDTAQLVAELRTLGISEEQAFAASRAARRILVEASN